jgi:hypothetical protein
VKETFQVQHPRNVFHLDITFDVDLESGVMKQSIDKSIGLLNGRTKDLPLHTLQLEMAILEKEMACQVFEGRNVPGQLKMGIVRLHLNAEDMSVGQCVAVIDLLHLSRKFDREDLDLSLPNGTKEGV